MLSTGNVSPQSIEAMRERIGKKQKLGQRANKLGGSPFVKEETFIVDASKAVADLEVAYQGALPPAQRNREGIYYTPETVVNEIFQKLPVFDENATFLEPSCGSGVFMEAAIRRGFAPKKVIGWDIDENALTLSRLRFMEMHLEIPQLERRDFLRNPPSPGNRFDLIATNPPWGKKLAPELKAVLAAQVDLPNTTDSSALFIARALSLLSPGGFLAFILPEAFFNVGAFESVRKRLLGHRLVCILDHGKIFRGLQSPATTIIVQRSTPRDESGPTVCLNSGSPERYRYQSSFSHNPKSIINHWCDERSAEVLEHLMRQEHLSLKGRAQWGLGIVTGDNKRLLRGKTQAGDVAVFRGSHLSSGGLRGEPEYISSDLSKLQQVAPESIYRSKEKLVYRFISKELVFFHDTEGRYFLNSANMFIPSEDFPLSQQQLCAFLNSRLSKWTFRMLFNTHKVLRKDLEELPIFQGGAAAIFDEAALLRSVGLVQNADGGYAICRQ